MGPARSAVSAGRPAAFQHPVHLESSVRTWILRFAGVTTLCALSFGMGAFFDGTGPESHAALSSLDDFGAERADWRELLPELRASADGDALRAIALESIDMADNDVALSEAIQVLGWVGVDDDAELLAVLVDEQTGSARIVASRALGHLGTDSAVDELMALRERKDPAIQDAVLRALGSTGSDDALDVLAQDLEDPSWESSAASALASHGTTQAARLLVRRFQGDETNQAWALAYALASFSPEAVPAARSSLRSALRSSDSERRNAAMHALANVHDEGIYDALHQASLTSNVTVQQQAIQALGNLGDPRAIPRLEEIARTGSQQVRHSAVYAIGSIGGDTGRETLITLVEIGPLDVGAAAANAFGDLNEEGVIDVLIWAVENRGTQVADASRNRLFAGPWAQGAAPEELFDLARETIEHRGSNSWTGQAYTFLLTHGGRADQDFILDILENGSAQQKSDALYALQTQPHVLPSSMLLRLVEDGDANVRRAALYALQQRGEEVSEELEDILLRRFENGGSMGGGWDDTEQALAQLGTSRANRALMDRVENGTDAESRRALSAIVYSGSVDQMDDLLDILEDSDDPAMRRRIYDNILYSSAPNLDEFVEHALDEEDSYVRANAVSALGRVGTPEARDQLRDLLDADDSQVRSAALSAVAQQGGGDAEKVLLEALDDPDTQYSALSGLQTLGTRSAREALVDVARNADDTSLRTQALNSLAWNGGKEGEAVILDALEDDDESVRSTAIYALQSVGSSRSADALADLIEDGDPEDPTTVQAAQVLSSMGGRAAEEQKERIEELLGYSADTMGDTGMWLEDIGYLEW